MNEYHLCIYDLMQMKSLYYDPEGKKIFTEDNFIYKTEVTTFAQNSPGIDKNGPFSQYSTKADKDRIKALENQIVQLNEQLQARNEKIVSHL